MYLIGTSYSLLAGWAFADSVLHRLAPLWVGARGLEFTWDYILQGLEANANLVYTHFFLVCIVVFLAALSACIRSHRFVDINC